MCHVECGVRIMKAMHRCDDWERWASACLVLHCTCLVLKGTHLVLVAAGSRARASARASARARGGRARASARASASSRGGRSRASASASASAGYGKRKLQGGCAAHATRLAGQFRIESIEQPTTIQGI